MKCILLIHQGTTKAERRLRKRLAEVG